MTASGRQTPETLNDTNNQAAFQTQYRYFAVRLRRLAVLRFFSTTVNFNIIHVLGTVRDKKKNTSDRRHYFVVLFQ